MYVRWLHGWPLCFCIFAWPPPLQGSTYTNDDTLRNRTFNLVRKIDEARNAVSNRMSYLIPAHGTRKTYFNLWVTKKADVVFCADLHPQTLLISLHHLHLDKQQVAVLSPADTVTES